MVNEPSVFEPLKFYCISINIDSKSSFDEDSKIMKALLD